MGKPTGFKEFKRKTEDYREISLRVKDYGEIFTGTHDVEHLKRRVRAVWIAVSRSASQRMAAR